MARTGLSGMGALVDLDGWTWIEFEAIPANIGPLSGGERRLLMIVASIGTDV